MKTSRSAFGFIQVPLFVIAICAFTLGYPRTAQAAAVRASRGTITLPTYPWLAATSHPLFRDTDGKNIYPYPMLDNLSREKTERTYRTVVLENEHLRITFLPELGGKIHEVEDKTSGQPMFYVNHVIKPGLIGMCGAWTSGGVEWNTGPQGHTVSAMQPVDVIILPVDRDGSRSVAIGETERVYGTKWTVIVTLRPGRSFIEERIRIYNPTDTVRPYYFWNCTAVANTPGFRFIYPMTLGSDHGAEKFFEWPLDHGKDLTRGTNYQDASSIFAWHCDQDFFGSYDDNADRGVVAFANHQQTPGKKAWTWGQGGFGKMHQMDLTDDDGPYNEVQTGPLLTQGEVGRLDPFEAVEWKEWWYPVHGIGGFNFANRDVAVNASMEGDKLRLRMIGTGAWRKAGVYVRDSAGKLRAFDDCALSPRPTELNLVLPPETETPEVELVAGEKTLARFRVPLDLPKRTRPAPKSKPETAAELAQSGWDHYLFARFTEAEMQFKSALEKDPQSSAARTGMAVMMIDQDPAAARKEAEKALLAEPNDGLARFVLAKGSLAEDETAALEHAWAASLDPAIAIAARGMAARILIGRRKFGDAIAALSDGPWEIDPMCRNLRALSSLMAGEKGAAVQLARASLRTDPLDALALTVLWLANAKGDGDRLEDLLGGNPISVMQIAATLADLKQDEVALRIVKEFYLDRVPLDLQEPMPHYWAEFLRGRISGARPGGAAKNVPLARAGSAALPYDSTALPVLKDACERNPGDGQAALYLGHVLFHLRRHDEGRAMWKRAAELGASPVIAWRALGMASLTLDKNLAAAAEHLVKAHAADSSDPVAARDLARVLFGQAEKVMSAEEKKALWVRARDTLQAAYPAGKGRSDFVCLLGRAHNRLNEFAVTARMLDSVRITVWEGSREAHELFQEAHLALGRSHLAASDPREALKEFDRALEYPENLATGKLENAREGHIHRLRADAFAALGNADAAREAQGKADREKD